MQMKIGDIGGAIVRKPFNMTREGSLVRVGLGTRLSADEVRAMGTSNRIAMIDKKYLELLAKPAPQAQAEGTERFLVADGTGKYFAVEGRKLHAKPLSREEAQKIASEGKTKAKRKVKRTKH